MEPVHFFLISGAALVGLMYLVWRKRKSKRDVYIVLGKIGITLVFGVLGLVLGIWVALKLTGPPDQEFSGLAFLVYALFSVPIGIIMGSIFGMTLFKLVGKLLSRKKNEKTASIEYAKK